MKIYLSLSPLSFVIHGIKYGQPITCSKVATFCLHVGSIWLKFPGKCQHCPLLENGPNTVPFVSFLFCKLVQ